MDARMCCRQAGIGRGGYWNAGLGSNGLERLEGLSMIDRPSSENSEVSSMPKTVVLS